MPSASSNSGERGAPNDDRDLPRETPIEVAASSHTVAAPSDGVAPNVFAPATRHHAPGERVYFVRTINGTEGPYGASELQELREDGRVPPSALCREVGSMDWVEVSRIALETPQHSLDRSPASLLTGATDGTPTLPAASPSDVVPNRPIKDPRSPGYRGKLFFGALGLVFFGEFVALNLLRPGPFWLSQVFIARLAEAFGGVWVLVVIAFIPLILLTVIKRKLPRAEEVSASMEIVMTIILVVFWLIVQAGRLADRFLPPAG